MQLKTIHVNVWWICAHVYIHLKIVSSKSLSFNPSVVYFLAERGKPRRARNVNLNIWISNKWFCEYLRKIKLML